ncbi:MAG: ANTAR domain-containing response regulator [Muricoprocola sp.]
MASIIVAFSKIEIAKNIKSVLMRSGYSVSSVCTSGAQVLQAADNIGEGLVICGYKFTDMQYDQLKECLPGDFDMLMIASESLISNCMERDIYFLELPLKVHFLTETIENIFEKRARIKRNARKFPKKRDEKEMQLIREAKELLMKENKMSEEEAHRYMQKCSMDSGTNLVETAQMIFALHESKNTD